MNALEPNDVFAVLTLSETGEILAARDACMAVFGRDVGALIGVNIRVLLKGGLDNEVGRMLHGHRAGKNLTDDATLRLIALKKDSAEFMASATTRKWNSDTTITKKSDAARLTWTIEFRDLTAPGEPATQALADQPSNDEVPSVEIPSDPKPEVPAAATPEEALGVQNQNDGPSVETPATPDEKGLPEPHPHREQEHLESQLPKANEDLEALKAESHRRAEQQKKVELELRDQLDAAKESASRAEAALKEETERKEKLEERLQTLSSSLRLEQAERSKRFEQELISLRQERDDLDRKLAVEQQAGTESTDRASDLEKRLAKNAADFERAKTELEQQNAERQRVESAWREQLDTAFIAKRQIEGAWAGEVERSKRLEEDLSQLRQEHDELASKLANEQQVVTESRQRAKEVESRLGRNAAESERARVELEKETAERERVEAVWRGQLAEANARREKSELALGEATRTSKRLEHELVRIQTERDDLHERLQTEQKVAADSARRADALQRAASQSAAELERIRGAHEELEKAHAGATERGLQLASELESLQQKHDGLAARLAAHQTTTDKSKGRVQEVKDLLEQRTAELESAQAELNEQLGQRDRLESEWKEQLDQVKAQAKELESAWTGAVDRNMHFEEMLSSLRAERDDLVRKLKTEKQAAAQARQQFEVRQNQVRESAAEPTHLKAEFEKRNIERARVEAELNKRLATATSLTKKLEAAWSEAVQRNRRLEAELEVLRRRQEEPSVHRKAAEPAFEKPAAAPSVKTSRPPSERDYRKPALPAQPAPQRALRSERNGTELNGKNLPSPKPAPGEKPNGHHVPEGKISTKGDLSGPPKPGVGLYNLKP
jgi:chromosome segregation ATPase